MSGSPCDHAVWNMLCMAQACSCTYLAHHELESVLIIIIIIIIVMAPAGSL